MKLRTHVPLGFAVLAAMVVPWKPPSLATGTTVAVGVIRVPHGGIQPELAVDANGVLHLVYFSGDPRAGDLYYVRSSDWGTTFSTPVRVNSQNGSAIAMGTIRGGQIAVGRNGRVHVAWNGSELSQPRGPVNPHTERAGAPLLYTRSNAAGTAFEPQRNVITQTFDLDGGGSVAADAEGRVYLAWHGNATSGPPGEATRRVWLARSSDDGATFSVEAPVWAEQTGACGCCGLRLFAAPAGGLHLMYRSARDAVNRDVYALSSRDRGATFRGVRLHEWDINACPMTSMFFAAAGARVLGAWETDGQVYFTQIAPEPVPSVPPVSPLSGRGGRKHPRLAIDQRGNTLLVWTEGMSWARGGSLAWQVFGADGRPVGTTGSGQDVPVWSFGAAFTRPDGGYVVMY